MCSHPRTGDVTDEKIAEKKSREIQLVEFFATKSRSLSEGGYTCDFRRALATRQFQKNRLTIASKKSLVKPRLNKINLIYRYTLSLIS